MKTKDILERAIELMKLDLNSATSYTYSYMCNAIGYACNGIKVPSIIGFNRENFKAFIEEFYPDLTRYLLCKSEAWIVTTLVALPEKDRIRRAKIEFLKSLIPLQDEN